MPENRETTAMGAAMLAGLHTGFWSGTDELKKIWRLDCEYTPQIDAVGRDSLLTNWHRAVERAKAWLNATNAS